MTDSERQTGTVKWFNEQKGYGFITPDRGGDDIFVHVTDLKRSNIDALAEGDHVSFRTQPSERRAKGDVAIDVRVA